MRALQAAEFWLLLAASVAAMLGVSGWVTIPLTVAGLSIVSLPKYVALWPNARAVGAESAWWQTVALSMLNALAAAGGVHVLGLITRWVWL